MPRSTAPIIQRYQSVQSGQNHETKFPPLPGHQMRLPTLEAEAVKISGGKAAPKVYAGGVFGGGEPWQRSAQGRYDIADQKITLAPDRWGRLLGPPLEAEEDAKARYTLAHETGHAMLFKALQEQSPELVAEDGSIVGKRLGLVETFADAVGMRDYDEAGHSRHQLQPRHYSREYGYPFEREAKNTVQSRASFTEKLFEADKLRRQQHELMLNELQRAIQEDLAENLPK